MQDQTISDAIAREGPRLRNFIRKRVADPGDAEDLLQDVYYELVEAYRLMHPMEQVTSWLYRVARNRIIDLWRRKSREEARSAPEREGEDEPFLREDLLPSAEGGPDELYARRVVMEALDEALDELPEEQREVFVEHEMMGYSLKEIAARTGVNAATLASRKHYAVLHLRERLRDIYDEFAKKTR